MGSLKFGEVSHYLLNKYSALLEEAEKDLSRVSCISRFRDAETRIKSKYFNANTTSKIARATSSGDFDVRELLYDLISALSECRVFAQQHRGAVAAENCLLKFKHFWFIRQMNQRLDDLDKKLNEVSNELDKKLNEVLDSEQIGSADSSSSSDDDDDDDGDEDNAYDDDEGDISGGFKGLDSAVEKIKEFIVEGSENDARSVLRGIGIVGVGGSGKTALARKVFDNLPVRRMFSPRIWVSLSDTLHDEPVSVDLRVKILRKMLEQAGCDVSEMMTTYVDIPKLTQKLYHRLMGKRYLIVLDEVWHVNDWYADLCSEKPKGDAFGDRISHALPKDSGGRIIVTTRRMGVAKELIGLENLIRIDTLLGQEFCWSLFSDVVCEDGNFNINDITPTMKEEISKKCIGLPLAARTLATIIPEQIKHHKQNAC